MTNGKRKCNKIIFHLLSGAILFVSLLFAIFRFQPVLIRTWQGIKDLGLSIAYYFVEMMGFYGVITPTVNEIPPNAIEILPFDPLEFKAKLENVGQLLFTKENASLFLQKTGEWLLEVAQIIALLAPIVLSMAYLLRFLYCTKNNDYNEDTKALKWYKEFERKTWNRAKAWIKKYVCFLFDYRLYVIAFCAVWIYNLNALTIIFEVLAYIFYMSVSLDLLHVYTLIAKVAMDLTVSVDFLPGIIWMVAGWLTFDWIRRGIALKRLQTYEKRNREFLDAHPGALFLTGKQRSKKTTIITDMALSQEQIFRDEALKRMMKWDKRFPFFPWINVELLCKEGQKRHRLPTLESCRAFLHRLEYHFNQDYNKAQKKSILRYYEKVYGYRCRDFLFDYDYKRYGRTYNDGLRIIDIFEALEAYLQQFYIYAAPTPLIFGNYAIRTDLKWEDYGNFPKYDGDFFKRKPEEMTTISDYSHIVDWDSLRLGKVVDSDNPYKDGFEVGCVTLMEIAKERGNQNTNQGITKDAKESNVKNDLFEVNIKMQGHAATVDYYTYFRLLLDDQRPDSLSADNKDLCDIVMIKSTSAANIVMPFSIIEEMLTKGLSKLYDKRYIENKVLRGDNTLLLYLAKKLLSPIFHHCERVEKRFSVYKAKLKVWDGMTEEVLKDNDVYYICEGKVYNDRFLTNAILDYYSRKAARSRYGLNDYPRFASTKMTVEEMEKMHSHFYMRLNRIFGKSKAESCARE